MGVPYSKIVTDVQKEFTKSPHIFEVYRPTHISKVSHPLEVVKLIFDVVHKTSL